MNNIEELDNNTELENMGNLVDDLVDDIDNTVDSGDYDIVPSEFLLEIQEISGKNVAQNYIDELIKKFEKLNIKYEFELVPNNEEIELNKYIGGSDLTFPYNYFDSFASNVKKVLNNPNTNENKNYILNLFQKKSKENTELPSVENEYVDENIDTNIDTNDKKKSTLVLPKHYTGLIKVYLLIYDKSMKSRMVGRIYDLNNWIKK